MLQGHQQNDEHNILQLEKCHLQHQVFEVSNMHSILHDLVIDDVEQMKDVDVRLGPVKPSKYSIKKITNNS
jgi:hypothetical protein